MIVDILDKGYEPSSEELADSIQGCGGAWWRDLTGFIEDNFKAKP